MLGRLYDYHVFDMLEFGVEHFSSLTAHKASSTPQLGNKVCIRCIYGCVVHAVFLQAYAGCYVKCAVVVVGGGDSVSKPSTIRDNKIIIYNTIIQ